jgi:hypothetical protein
MFRDFQKTVVGLNYVVANNDLDNYDKNTNKKSIILMSKNINVSL